MADASCGEKAVLMARRHEEMVLDKIVKAR
jgi:hypothetical protein